MKILQNTFTVNGVQRRFKKRFHGSVANVSTEFLAMMGCRKGGMHVPYCYSRVLSYHFGA
jgi:hypothetical protein